VKKELMKIKGRVRPWMNTSRVRPEGSIFKFVACPNIYGNPLSLLVLTMDEIRG